MPSYEPLVEGLPTRPAPFIDALFANSFACEIPLHFGASELQGTAGHCRALQGCWPRNQGVDQADAFKRQAIVDDSRISAVLSR